MPRNGGDKRGKSKDRARRKTWMLAMFGSLDTGICPCVHCEKEFPLNRIEQDRIIPGGSYRRTNIQPSCKPCNLMRSNNPDWVHPNKM
jgi:hypothetical protein